MKESIRRFISKYCTYFILISIISLPALATDSAGNAYKGLPKLDKDGRLPTLNKTGWIIAPTDPYSQEFIEYSLQSSMPSLEIGAGYGFATLEVLKRGGVIYANDLSVEHLNILKGNTPNEFKDRLTLMPGKFQDLKIDPDSLQAVLAVRVLHFLDGLELKASAKQIYEWLAPGGKVFVVAETPYLKPWIKFLPVYLESKVRGDEFPGLVTDAPKYNTTRSSNLPTLINFLDTEVLSRVFKEAGFAIEKVDYIDRKGVYPENMLLDGRESVGLVASKPK